MKNFILFLLLINIISCSSTGTEKEKLPAGTCVSNVDCPDGYRCNGNVCEDIYFPRKNIKNY